MQSQLQAVRFATRGRDFERLQRRKHWGSSLVRCATYPPPCTFAWHHDALRRRRYSTHAKPREDATGRAPLWVTADNYATFRQRRNTIRPRASAQFEKLARLRKRPPNAARCDLICTRTVEINSRYAIRRPTPAALASGINRRLRLYSARYFLLAIFAALDFLSCLTFLFFLSFF